MSTPLMRLDVLTGRLRPKLLMCAPVRTNMMKGALIGMTLTAFLAVGTAAQASSTPRVTVALHNTLRESANYPNSGASAVYAGTVRTRKLGRGAILQTVTITSHPSSGVFKFKGTSTAYYSRGTAKSAFTGTGTLQGDGRFMLVGRGHYTGGTLYDRTRGKYSFTGTAPPPPPQPCAVPAGWQTAAGDADLVVIEAESGLVQDYQYCDYADPSRGFQVLVNSDSCGLSFALETCSTVDGVALSDILYDTSNSTDSPACGGPNPVTDGSSTVYGVDTTSGRTVTLAQGPGGITSAQISPPGVAAWILTYDGCLYNGSHQRTETLEAYSFRTGQVTTLDTGDPGEPTSSPRSLANLQLYQCATTCSGNGVIIAWTHDGTWHYQQSN